MDWMSIGIVGVVVGLFARTVFSGERPLGVTLTTSLGVAGAALVSLPAQAMGLARTQDPTHIAYSVFGSVALLALYGVWASTRPAPSQN